MTNTPLLPSLPSSPDPVHSWIKWQAIPFITADPQASLEDLAPLKQVMSNASIIGLGEASHGAHEFFVLKHRLLRFLVEEMGFTLFAMEADWMSCEPMNEYLLTGVGDVKQLLAAMGYTIWQTQEVLDLFTWIRAYNADPAHTQKVHFAGFDCGAIRRASLTRIVQFFQVVDPAQSERIEQLYEDLDTLSWKSLPEASIREQAVQAAQQVLTLLREHQQDYSQRSSPERFAAILQEASIVEQVTMELAVGLVEPGDPQLPVVFQQREHFMAKNVAWLHEHAPGGEKMVLWAHNWHIGTWGRWCCDPRGKNGPYTWMGMQLRERYHQQYLPIGFSFFEGALNAALVDGDGNYLPSSTSWQPCVVKPALAGSYNAALAQAGILYLLDLRNAPTGEVKNWLDGPHPFRLFDTDYNSNEDRFYHQVSLPEWFDAIVHVYSIRPSQGLPPDET